MASLFDNPDFTSDETPARRVRAGALSTAKGLSAARQ
jgi:hypothetical protein